MALAKCSDDELLSAIRQHGSNRAAAKALGLNPRSVERRRARLAQRGWSPEHDMTKTVPDGFTVKGVSTLYKDDGSIAAQWVKSTRDAEAQLELMRAFVNELSEDVKGLAKPIKCPARTLADSLSAYIIGDAHFGMYSWEKETGEDFDTSIASEDLRAAIDLLVAGSPASETGYLVDVGDYLHADNRSNMTPASGNLLDVDTRYQRVIRIAADAMRYCIGRMLDKHKFVKLFVMPGNHNPDSAGWMAMVMQAYYEKEKRVEVERSPSKFFYQRFGTTLIGITHGDKVKLADLPSIMACDRPKDWGETTYRMWWHGHFHHSKHQEYRGCTVEGFNTLAASDAWHAASGYRSARQMQRIDIDREHGIYNRGIASIGRVRASK
jgi:hypothetical protein